MYQQQKKYVGLDRCGDYAHTVDVLHAGGLNMGKMKSGCCCFVRLAALLF